MRIEKVLLTLSIVTLFIGCSKEKKEWENSTAENTFQAYEGYIGKYPESAYVDSAIYAIWNLTKLTEEISTYENFINNFPESRYLDSAKHIVEIMNYNEAVSIDQIEEYNDFIIKYPESIYKDSVNIRIRDINLENEFNSIYAKQNVTGIQNFIVNNPDATVLKKFQLNGAKTFPSQPKNANKGYRITLKKLNKKEFSYLLTIPPNTEVKKMDFDSDFTIEKGSVMYVTMRDGKMVSEQLSGDDGTVSRQNLLDTLADLLRCVLHRI